MAGRKVFVGSLPPTINGDQLREVFCKYGIVEEIYIKPDCEPGRQWAFVTFSSHEEAQYAKECCDRQVTFPGSDQPCDVMLAKTRMGGKGGGGPFLVSPPDHSTGAFNQPAPGYVAAQPNAARKVFVGSLPGNITEDALRNEFSKYGFVEDIFIKPNCEPGRQWAFVNFSSPEQAAQAAQAANGFVQFPGCIKPCEVTLARNQGLFGQDPLSAEQPRIGQAEAAYGQVVTPPTEAQMAPRKVFVGSLPDGITDPALRSEFSKYGMIVDLYMKNNCEPGRHWAFITYASHEEALFAKESCDRVLQFPGADRPCEVTLARHQGMFGKDAIDTGMGQAGTIQYSAGGNYSAREHYTSTFVTPAPSLVEGPRKIFVGSLPDAVGDAVLRAEFSKYGQIVDLFIKKDASERNRQWAFVTFATSEQAAFAKESTDRVLLLPGADRACEVMLAKNQGKFGQAPLTQFGVGVGGAPLPAHSAPNPALAEAPPMDDGFQPPPPAAPPPPHLTAWRMYRTASGIPYYHNSTTGITQWECPPDLQLPGQPPGQPPPNAYAQEETSAAAGQRYTPY